MSSARACTGEVWVRSTVPASGSPTNRVSCIVRAGWSGMKLRASKLSHSASSSGPSATSQPMATKTSIIWSISAVIGWIAPVGASVDRQRHVDPLLDQALSQLDLGDLAPRDRPGPALIRPRA